MKIAGLIKQSLVDYPGRIAAVLFTRGCNFRCPFCHNGHLVYRPGSAEKSLTMEEILPFLQERQGFLDAVVISGGEPTLNESLPDACRSIKDLGYLVKLDTNGTNPAMLEKLLAQGLLDYVAMDIKAPLDYQKYLRVCGKLSSEDFFNVRNAIHLLKNSSIKVEFRTTVVPSLHTETDIINIACSIEGAELYSLQQFRPENTLDPDLGNVVPYTKQQLESMAQQCRSYIKKVQVLNV